MNTPENIIVIACVIVCFLLSLWNWLNADTIKKEYKILAKRKWQSQDYEILTLDLGKSGKRMANTNRKF